MEKLQVDSEHSDAIMTLCLFLLSWAYVVSAGLEGVLV